MNRYATGLLILFVSCAALFLVREAGAEEPVVADPDTATVTADSAAVAEAGEKEDKKKEKTFEETVADHQVVEGLFTFYRKDDEAKVYMEIRPEQFERVFLCTLTRESADGHYFHSSSMMYNFPFILKRVGKRVQLLHKNVYFRAEGSPPIQRAIDRGLSNSIVGSTKLVECLPHPERNSILVDATDLFVQDIGMVGTIFSEHIKKVKYSLDKDNSAFGPIKSFQRNCEIDVVLQYKSSNPKAAYPIPDPRSFEHTYHYSLSALPRTAYRPRLADDRVGHFLTMYQDYSSALRDTPYNRYVSRWNLVKADPKASRSRPRKPIVFHMENTVPVEYRDAVRKGILLWNDAFERIGFKDAIVVKQQPDDAEWDPADVRYNTVRWFVAPGAGYARGPSHTNPFTGEIYDADIMVSADMVRYVFRSYEEFTNPVAIGDSIAAALGLIRNHAQGACNYATEAAQQAAFGWDLLSARGLVGQGDDGARKYIEQYLTHVIAHEIGHTLGLRHNFKASAVHPADQLHDKDLTGREGIASSVMDYLTVNIAPEGQKQGHYFQNVLGRWDYWAIEYAYRSINVGSTEAERPELEKIASKSADPRVAYGTDEDAFSDARGIDPTANRWDIGDDPIRFHRERIALGRELWTKIESEFEVEGARYQKLRTVFGRGFGPYRGAAENVTKFIGGMYFRRDHVGDPGARVPFEPVPAEKQREALALLVEHLFGRDSFRFPPSLLSKLAPERFYDFTDAIWKVQRIDYPVHDVVLSTQRRPLNALYHPIRLSRMLDLELHAADEADAFTMVELFDGIRDAIWAELAVPDNVNSFRRALQRVHLAKLVSLVVSPPAGTPRDASALARADLSTLKAAIGEALTAEALDRYTRAHLDEAAARIDAALEAGMQRPVGG